MVVVGGEEGTEEKDVDKERQESCTQGAGIYCRAVCSSVALTNMSCGG